VRAVAVVPTYNEAENIVTLCRAIRAAAPDLGILVVDDNSPDGTADLAEEVAREIGDVEVLRRTEKSGLGAAYRAGMRAAIDRGAEICIQIDADLSHDPAALPALVSAVEHGADLALGSRYVPGGITENWPRRRRWLSRWGNRYAAAVLGLAVNDATGGYRAYSTRALVDLVDFETVRAEGYGFQIEMTHRVVRAGGRIVEIPITFRDREEGRSKMSHDIVNEAFTLVLRLWAQDRKGRKERRRAGR
jgi:glycosyltransferase involved in cell wall biosynthesis